MAANRTARVMDAVAVSGTGTYCGNPTEPPLPGKAISYVVIVTGSPVGTLTFEYSNDNQQEADTDLGSATYATGGGTGTWSPLTTLSQVGTGLTVSNGAVSINGAVTFGVVISKAAFARYRPKYVNSSSTGNVTVKVAT